MLRSLLDRAGFAAVATGVFVVGVLQSQYVLTLRLEIAAFVVFVVLGQAVASSLSYTAFTLCTGALLLWQLFAQGDPDCRVEAGEVTAIVPVYCDAAALHRSVESLLAAAYEGLSIRIVVEPDDEASRREAERLASNDGVSVLVNERRPGSKAGAINHALAETDSPYVAVFDADERVHPQFVAAAVRRLTEGADVIQGRTVPQPTGVVETLAYAESVLLSYGARRVPYLLTGFRMAASRAVVARREAVETVGGYDETKLTEDFEFAYRCYRARLDVVECLAYPSRIEGAHTLRDWWGQRKRWMTGYVQTLHGLLGDVRPVTDYRNLTSVVFAGGTLVGTVMLFTLSSKIAVLALAGEWSLVAAPLGAASLVTLGVGLHDRATGAVRTVHPAWVLVPAVVPLYSLAALKAVLEYLTTWNGEWYSVTKGVD